MIPAVRAAAWPAIGPSMPQIASQTDPGGPVAAASPIPAARAGFAATLKQYGSDRLLDYANLGKDILKILTTNPGTTLTNLYNTIFQNNGNPLLSFVSFLGAIANNFVTTRVSPYIAAIKEGNIGKVGALLTVDALDILTFAFVVKGFKALRTLLLGTPAVPGGGGAVAAMFRGAAGKGIIPVGVRDGVQSVLVTAGTALASWSIFNAGLRSITAVGAQGVRGLPIGFPTSAPGSGGADDRSHAKVVETTAQILRQNGLALNPFALNLLADRTRFTERDVLEVQERLLMMNKANLPFIQRDVDPANPRRFNGVTYEVSSLELDYMRWLPPERYEAIRALADKAEGFKFYKRLLIGVPEAQRNVLPLLVSDLRTYMTAMGTLKGDYRLGDDADLDVMLEMKASPRDVLAFKIKLLYPSMTDQAIADYVNRLWSNLSPPGERRA